MNAEHEFAQSSMRLSAIRKKNDQGAWPGLYGTDEEVNLTCQLVKAFIEMTRAQLIHCHMPLSLTHVVDNCDKALYKTIR